MSALTHSIRLSIVLAALVGCDRADATKSAPLAPPSASTTPKAATVATKDFDEASLKTAAPHTITGRVVAGDEPGGTKDSVVYIKAGLPKGAKPTPGKVNVDQVDKAFIPRVVPVLAGTTVEFKNSDAVLHNVYSRAGVKTFDLGAFPNKETRSAVFDKVGRVDVFCAIHTNMHAIVYVVDSPYFATTDAKGVFAIKDVPPGKYTLGIWSETHDEREQEVEVKADEPAIVHAKLEAGGAK